MFPFFAGYNSTKWALEGFSEGLWHELKPFGIRVKAIEPGFVETAIWGKVLPGDDEPAQASEHVPPLHGGDARVRGLDHGPHPTRAAPRRSGAP